MLLEHWIRRAASRADCTAGNSSETKMPMIVMTTSSSTSVKARRRLSPANKENEAGTIDLNLGKAKTREPAPGAKAKRFTD